MSAGLRKVSKQLVTSRCLFGKLLAGDHVWSSVLVYACNVLHIRVAAARCLDQLAGATWAPNCLVCTTPHTVFNLADFHRCIRAHLHDGCQSGKATNTNHGVVCATSPTIEHGDHRTWRSLHVMWGWLITSAWLFEFKWPLSWPSQPRYSDVT